MHKTILYQKLAVQSKQTNTFSTTDCSAKRIISVLAFKWQFHCRSMWNDREASMSGGPLGLLFKICCVGCLLLPLVFPLL